MNLTRSMKVWIAAGITTVAVGCSDALGPPEGLAFSAATSSCGPTDGPAIAIYLASEPIEALNPSRPFVFLHVNRARDEAASGSWARMETGELVASRHTPIPEAEFATTGGIRIDVVEADNTIKGRVNVVFPSGRVAGSFRAEWTDRPGPLCG